MEKVKNFNELHDDAIHEIFDYLDERSLKNSMAVCTK